MVYKWDKYFLSHMKAEQPKMKGALNPVSDQDPAYVSMVNSHCLCPCGIKRLETSQKGAVT